MFKALKIRWLVTAFAAAAAMLVVSAPAGAWEDVAGGRMDGNGTGSMPPQDVQKRMLQSNLVHEGRQAERRLAAQSSSSIPVVSGVAQPSAIVFLSQSNLGQDTRDLPFTRPDSRAGTVASEPVVGEAFTRPDSRVGTVLPDDTIIVRDAIVTDKPAPQTTVVRDTIPVVDEVAQPSAIPYLSHGQGLPEWFGEIGIPGGVDPTTGLAPGVDRSVPVEATIVSDGGGIDVGNLAVGLAAALGAALLMALGVFTLVHQRRRPAAF